MFNVRQKKIPFISALVILMTGCYSEHLNSEFVHLISLYFCRLLTSSSSTFNCWRLRACVNMTKPPDEVGDCNLRRRLSDLVQELSEGTRL